MSGNGHLRSFVERIERLEEEIKALNDDKSDIYKEAKGEGFDVKTLRRVIQARRKDPADRAESDILFDTYMTALEGGTQVATRARTIPSEIPTSNPAGPLDAGGLVKASPEPSKPTHEPGEHRHAAKTALSTDHHDGSPYMAPHACGAGAAHDRTADPAAPSIPEPVAPALRDGQPLAGAPNSPPASGAPDLTIPPFLRRVPA